MRALMTMPPGASLMVSMPTGAGKSLLFQMGALWWQEHEPQRPVCIVVIVPTVGLAKDHAHSLAAFAGLENSQALTADVPNKAEVLTAFIRGEIPVLVMNPETALGSARQTLQMACLPEEDRLGDARAHLAALVVDEAHIVESWGRSFRPDFQRLVSLRGRLKEANPALRTLLLSATLSDESRRLLRRDYGGAAELLEVHASVPRNELDLFARRFDSEVQRERVLLELVDLLPRPAIIYTTTKAAAGDLLGRLLARGFSAVAQFTGDTDPAERQRVLELWRGEALDVVVATSAFGMGIDKSDVRTVVHACLPEDAARYYQEVGRSGRDGHRAVGACLWTTADQELARSMRSKEWLKVETSVERWRRLVDRASGLGPRTLDEATGRWSLDVDLNAAPERLGRDTGERNREWNRTLLNLMQRAGAIQVLQVDKRSHRWRLEVLESWVLDCDAKGGRLRDVFALRSEERQRSNLAFDAFVETMQGDLCLLAETFHQIEGGTSSAGDCGRCGPCIAAGARLAEGPRCGGLEQGWSRPWITENGPSLQATILVEHAELDLPDLLERQLPVLAGLGYLQFLVPDRFVASASEILAGTPGRMGLLLGFEESNVLRWRSWDLPTAVLLDGLFPGVYQQAFVRAHLSRPRDQRPPLLVMAREGYRLDGKHLNQWVDTTYSPDFLEGLLSERRSLGVEQ